MGHVTPLPYKRLFPLCAIYFIEAFVFTNIFSYVGFMVQDFHLTDDLDKVGYYAGYIGSTFSVAGFLSSFWWGRISDRYGRRPVLIFGCVGGMLSTLVFGFSTSLEMAIASRFAAGLLNGNVGVVKGYAAIICDKTNQAKGVGVMQLGWGLGGIVGPLVGGLFARPCRTNFHCSQGSILNTFPYLLPNLFSCLVSIIAIITLVVYLPKEDIKYKSVEMTELNKDEFSIDGADDNLDLEFSISTDDKAPSATLQAKLARQDSFAQDTDRLQGSGELGFKGWISRKVPKDSIFRNSLAMRAVISYSILGASFTMFEEAFPLFMVADTSSGGLNASGTDVGLLGMINGLITVFAQLVIFFPIASKLGFIRLYRLGLILGVLLFANYPSAHFFVSNHSALWAFLCVTTCFKAFTGLFSFSSVTAIISNSCPMTQVGAINGLAQSSVALLRAFSPAIAGNILAWGFSNGRGFPWNQYLIFIIISFTVSISCVMAMFLPRSLDYPHETPLLPIKGGEEKDANGGKEDKDNPSMLQQKEGETIQYPALHGGDITTKTEDIFSVE